jgi:hypothetical protein
MPTTFPRSLRSQATCLVWCSRDQWCHPRGGDTNYEFPIQSVSKPFVFALVCQAIGEDEARATLGVNSTGLPFNSVIAIERTDEGTTNPMVNAEQSPRLVWRQGKPQTASGSSSAKGCQLSPGGNLELIGRSIVLRRSQTSATKASQTCFRPTGGSISIRQRRRKFIPDSALLT